MAPDIYCTSSILIIWWSVFTFICRACSFYCNIILFKLRTWSFCRRQHCTVAFYAVVEIIRLNNTYYLSYIHDTPIATFPGLAPSTAGSIGAPEWDLRYSVMLKWHEFDPLYNFTLAHAKTCEQIVPNMYAIPWNCSLQIEGHRWLAIDPYIQIIKRPFWFIGWWIKIKLVLILDFLFSYTPGSYCSINFWYYKCLRIAFFIIFIFIAYIKLRISVIEVESITINLNKDMLIFIKKYLSFSPKRWANYFYGINS